MMGVIMLLGCERTKNERSSRAFLENAEVVDLVFTPSGHGSGSGVGPSINMNGGLGISFVSVSVDIPEVYSIIFECEHGKFIVQSNKHKESEKIKELWSKLKKNQKVVVTYYEVYKNTYDGDKLKESHLVKYDFIDAKPK
jgi:hypothetical protein